MKKSEKKINKKNKKNRGINILFFLSAGAVITYSFSVMILTFLLFLPLLLIIYLFIRIFRHRRRKATLKRYKQYEKEQMESKNG